MIYDESRARPTRRKPKRRRPQHNAHVWTWAQWRIGQIYANATRRALDEVYPVNH